MVSEIQIQVETKIISENLKFIILILKLLLINLVLKVKNSKTEQCDDGNQETGDGCYQCQAECPYCQICNYQNKCQVCLEHFHSVNMICLPIFRDNFIEPGLEECDDGNQIQYDGCYNCQLECDTRCKKCHYGQFKDICKFNELEIENDWNCFRMNTQINQCFSITQESLEYLNQTKYCQYVILANNSETYNFPAKDSFQILGLQSDEYIINCNPKVPISQIEFRNIRYEFKYIFTTKQTLDETILDEMEWFYLQLIYSLNLRFLKF